MTSSSASFGGTGVDQGSGPCPVGAVDSGDSTLDGPASSRQGKPHRRRQRAANLSINTSSAAGETQLLTLVDNVGGDQSAGVFLRDDESDTMVQMDVDVLSSAAFSPHLAAVGSGGAATGGSSPASLASAALLSDRGGQFPLAVRNSAAAAAGVGFPGSPASATASPYAISPMPGPETRLDRKFRYNCAAVKADIERILDDESPRVGAWASLCACCANRRLRSLNASSIAAQTAALFNLASHALLGTGSSCRKSSQAYAEALVRAKPADFPLTLPTSPLPVAGVVEHCMSPTGAPPGSVRIPIHHLLHHLSLPPHSHPLSLAVLGFCYEFGLTKDTVEVPVSLLMGYATLRHADGEAQDAAKAPSTTPRSGSSTPVPSTPDGSAALNSHAPAPLSSTMWQAYYRKAEVCYIGALYFSSLFAPRSKWPPSPLGSDGLRTPGRTGFTPCSPLAAAMTPPPPPTVGGAKHPDHLALSRLAFLRKYGRPGVRIDRREADALVALVNSACEELGAGVETPVAAQFRSPKGAGNHGLAAAQGQDDSVGASSSVASHMISDGMAVELGDDNDFTVMDEDFEDAALAYWIKTTDHEAPELNGRSRSLSLTNGRIFVDRPSSGVDESARPVMVYHAFDTDGLSWLAIAAKHYAHPASQYAFGGCQHEGVGFGKDEKRAFKWYLLSAIGGHPRGMGILGYCYIEGFGPEKDDVTALKWYQLAALHNDSVAIYNIGYCYEDGIGVEKDPQEAVKWYHASAEQGNSFAQNSLGYCYEDAIGVEKNVVEAIKWYTLSAEQGYPWAECNLGYCYQNGIGVEKDETVGAYWYSRAAKQGHARAQHNLGFCYQNGNGVPKDEYRAVYWYIQSAELENTFAFHSLGYCYQNGIGVPVNEELAVAWYKKAADEGHAPAQLSLGYCYRNGTGVPVSETLAVRYFALSAEQGNSLAHNSLGFCYEEGLGVEKNPELAVHWYRKSAQQGNPWAQCNIGYCYAHGFGVERSLEKAFEWYERAAQQDHARAQDKVGACYQFGNGVEVDYVRAVYWYRLAAERHNHVGAMFHLARCLEEGIGCELNLQEAVRFYEEAGRAGCVDSQKRMTRILSTWCLSGLSLRFGNCAPCA